MKTMSQVPFVDLKGQYESLKGEILPAIEKVLDSCAFILGPEVAAFEKEFAEYVGTKHAIAVNTGTSALHVALEAAGVGPGDEVISVPMTFVATTAAIVYCGARTVLVDVDPVTHTMNPALVEAAITPHTKAIIPVHLYGQPADLGPIQEICRKHNLILLEDACQAHGAEYKGQRCGSLGHMGAFSFYPGKNLGAYGDSGLAVTNDDELARKMRMLRDWGCEKKYHHELSGYNYRMDNIQGAILRIKLRHLEKWTEARRAHAAFYDQHLKGLNLEFVPQKDYARHVYHLYPILVENRDQVMRTLAEEGVQSGIHYPIPVHLQPAYANLGYKEGDFPVSESIARRTMSLPMFPEMTQEQAQRVVDAVKKAVK